MDSTVTSTVVMGGGSGQSPTCISLVSSSYLKAKLRDLFLEDIKSRFEVCDCVTEHGGIICIFHIHKVLVVKLDSCGLLVDT